MVLTTKTLVSWKWRGVMMNFRGRISTNALTLKGGMYAKMASDLTPSMVSTARLYCISGLVMVEIWLKVVLSIETRMVRKSVFPRKAKVTNRMDPSSQWKSVDFWIPLPSRPNQV